jgi:FKBP-type peptidyl-prolyl cis-trans isomerase 2
MVISQLLASPVRAEEEKPIVIKDGVSVSIEYTLKLDDGSVVDTNVGQQPLAYQQGESQILPALEGELAGLGVGDEKKVTLSPEQGYGPVDPEAYQEVPLEVIPEDAREVGTQLVSTDGAGNRRVVRVHEVREQEVVLNLNHPLAGETLHFDIRVIGVD